MDHEIAHGLYFTNKKYKRSCDILVSEIKKKDYNSIRKALIKMGYTDDRKIIDDEIQAFFSTGLYKSFDNDNNRKYVKGFQNNFKEYYSK
jgi:hypothetical protein